MRATVAGALLTLVALAPADGRADDPRCPDAPSAHEAIRKRVTAERQPMWVASIGRFEFGPTKIGAPMKLPDLEGGGRDIDACMVEVVYTYRILLRSGEERIARGGSGEIHAFHKDAFDDWTYRVLRP